MPSKPTGRPRGRPKKKNQPTAIVEAPKPKLETLRVHIYPSFGEEDEGDGGIRRVVEGQIKYLPQFGIEVVNTPEEADIIACHVTIPPPYLKNFPDKPIVALLHGVYWSEYEWQNWSYKANKDVFELARLADAIVAPSEWVANSIRRHLSRPVSVIPHGVELSDWTPEASPAYVLWNKTRVDPVCDPEPVNHVAARLKEVQFVSTFAQEASNVLVTGRLAFDKAKKLIEGASAYLCTARETFGVGTLEALACGVPVVGFNWGGQAEFIEHKVDGWLATPGDYDGLAEGIEWAIENKKQLTSSCQAKAGQYTWEKAASLYASLFREVYQKKLNQIHQPLVSIIVTNYNLEKYLPACLYSIQNQTISNWECIIVDDASPNEEGLKIAREFAESDSRFRVIHNEENVYLAEARNIGIRAAFGKYILPLDADDLLAPKAIQLLSEALDADKTIHVAYGGVFFVDEDGRTPTDYGTRLGPGLSGWPMTFSHEQQMLQRNLLPYCSMFRREAWENVGGYRRRCRTAEDADIWSRLSSYGFRPKMVTSEITLVYRNREGSMSRTQGGRDWLSWFTWAKRPELTPAGAVTKDQLPIPSLDPCIISVIIPVGPGHEKYVHDAIDSVDAQTFKNWECIVVNDTNASLPEFPAWVKVVTTSGRLGPAAARNVGIRESKGWLFLPLDADDYLEPEALQIMYDAWMETKDIIYCDFWQDRIGFPDEFSIHECDDYDPYLITGQKRTVKGQVREGMMRSVVALTPKKIWEDVGGYDESLVAWEDWDFQIAAADKGYCERRVPLPLFVYRMNTGFRRDENFDTFDVSKDGIIKKWSYVEGGQLMACRTCGGNKNYTPIKSGGNWGQVLPKQISGDEEAVLIEYTGTKMGRMAYRGSNGNIYYFAAGDPPKYVLKRDLEIFTRYPDFKVASITRPGNVPALMAEGKP